MDNSNQKKFSTISDTDKIIIDYLIQRQNQIDSFYDTIDSKIFQILTIDGVIFGLLAITIDKLSSSVSIKIGAGFIFVSVIFGILGCRLHNYHIGVSEEIDEILLNIDSQQDELRINKLKDVLKESIKQNLDSFYKKGEKFGWALTFLYFGVAPIIIGYSGYLP